MDRNIKDKEAEKPKEYDNNSRPSFDFIYIFDLDSKQHDKWLKRMSKKPQQLERKKERAKKYGY